MVNFVSIENYFRKELVQLIQISDHIVMSFMEKNTDV